MIFKTFETLFYENRGSVKNIYIYLSRVYIVKGFKRNGAGKYPCSSRSLENFNFLHASVIEEAQMFIS